MDAKSLREVLAYEPKTGIFRWLSRPSRRVQIGDIAGNRDSTNASRVVVRIRVFGKNFYAHRLAWLHVHGEWPGGEVDHINGDSSDNRIENLRVVSHRVNMQNQRRARADNESGQLGVSRCRTTGKWRARLKYDGREVWLGRHATKVEAQAAYISGKRRLHAGCTL